MDGNSKKIYVYFIAWVVILIMPLCGSCVYDKEFQYTNDQIKILKSTTSDIQNTIKSKLETVYTNQADMRIEIEGLKKDLSELAGRIEDNEKNIKYIIETDLNEQDTLRNDISELKGLAEKIDRLEKLLNYHHEYLNLETFNFNEDSRVSGMETGPETVLSDGSTQKPKDVTLYETSLTFYNNENYSEALKGFKSFLEAFPKSELADNAYFWIGECFMVLKDYENAIRAYQEVIEKYPKENKVPNAMLRQSIAWLEIDDEITSKYLLQKVLKNYPNSPEAKIAEKKLSSIK